MFLFIEDWFGQYQIGKSLFSISFASSRIHPFHTAVWRKTASPSKAHSGTTLGLITLVTVSDSIRFHRWDQPEIPSCQSSMILTALERNPDSGEARAVPHVYSDPDEFDGKAELPVRPHVPKKATGQMRFRSW
jgi:hypothetical protein